MKQQSEPPQSERPHSTRVKTRKSSSSKKRETFTIGFRVDGSRLSALESGASEVSLSVHEYARLILFQKLDQQNEQRIREEVEQVHDALQALRAELIEAVSLLLMNIVDEDSAAIRTLVERVLRGSSDEE